MWDMSLRPTLTLKTSPELPLSREVMSSWVVVERSKNMAHTITHSLSNQFNLWKLVSFQNNHTSVNLKSQTIKAIFKYIFSEYKEVSSHYSLQFESPSEEEISKLKKIYPWGIPYSLIVNSCTKKISVILWISKVWITKRASIKDNNTNKNIL
jgi:hypothetical protein